MHTKTNNNRETLQTPQRIHSSRLGANSKLSVWWWNSSTHASDSKHHNCSAVSFWIYFPPLYIWITTFWTHVLFQTSCEKSLQIAKIVLNVSLVGTRVFTMNSAGAHRWRCRRSLCPGFSDAGARRGRFCRNLFMRSSYVGDCRNCCRHSFRSGISVAGVRHKSMQGFLDAEYWVAWVAGCIDRAVYIVIFVLVALWLMIAFITCKSSLIPLLEGLCTSNLCRFEFSVFWVFAGIESTTSELTVLRSDQLS